MSVLVRLMLTALPVAIVWTLAWFGVFTFVNAYVARGLGASTREWTVLTLWFVGGVMVWQLVMTEISSRLGRRRAVFAVMVLSGILFAPLPFVSNLTLLGILLGGIACMHATYFVVWLPMVAGLSRTAPGRGIALTQLICSVTTLVVLLGGGRLIVGGAFRVFFPLSSLLCLGSAVVFLLISHPFEQAELPPVLPLRCLRWDDLRSLMTGLFPWILFCGLLLEPFGFHTANQLLPNLAREVHGLGEGAIGTVVAFGRVPALLSLLCMAHFIDRWNPTFCYGVALIVVGGGVVLMGTSTTVPLLVVAYLLYHAGQGAIWGSNSAAINSVVEPRLKDSAFAFMGVLLMGAVFGAGFVHNRLVASGLALPGVFKVCG
ncbi:MAG: MFS transporter, partial [Lentisphaeria bacterium]|nr:MFS transporter [Lentisphaeria bacterium]